MPDKSYLLLALALRKKEFYWTVPNDDNRGIDGKFLRDCFRSLSSEYDDADALDGPCNMLELLIGLARRMDDTMQDPEGPTGAMSEEDRVARWFWEILGNVGLDYYTDEVWVEKCGTMMVDMILNRILDRTYHRNGKGGLFPLRTPKKDQRKVEIWYQMSTYLLENYYSSEEEV
jgi:hypothetical protein